MRALCALWVLLLIGCAHHPVDIPTPLLMPPPQPLKEVKIALVLGAGGARGVAHSGVMSVLEENDIPIDLIVGSSAGSIIGALYADNPNSKTIHEKLKALSKWDLLDPSIANSVQMTWRLGGINDGYALRAFLLNHLSSHSFEELKIPLAIVTTDVEKGEIVVIRSGPLIPAIHASSAIPMVFKPVQLYGKKLVDGGVISPVPVETAKSLGAEYVISVDIGDIIEPTNIYGTLQMLDRCLWLSYNALSRWEDLQADVHIKPKFKQNHGIFDDQHTLEYYYLGRDAALKALPELLKLKQKALKG